MCEEYSLTFVINYSALLSVEFKRKFFSLKSENYLTSEK